MAIEKKEILFYIRRVLCYLAAILAGLQILTGVVWILFNFTSGCESEASARYLAAAENGQMDEYIGVLYPLLIKIARMIAIPFGGAYEQVLYLIQLVVAVAGYRNFWKLSSSRTEGEEKNSWCYWGMGLLLATIPLCVQWHLTILPNSLTASVFMILLGQVLDLWHHHCAAIQWKRMLWIGILWMLLVLLMPDYLWLSLPLVLFAVVGFLKNMRKQRMEQERQVRWRQLLLVTLPVLLVLMAVGINHTVQQPGSGGRIQKSVEAAMVSRFVWPHFGTNYFFWPDEIKQIMTAEEGAQISTYADLVQTVFGPLVESHYGREEANRLYAQMARSCLEYRTKEVITAVCEDMIAYLNPLWEVKEHLGGAGLSYTGYHYDKMRENTPLLTKWYVHYGLIGFRMALFLAALCGLIRFWDTGKGNRKKRVYSVAIITVCLLLHAAWYGMSGAGTMEYGNVCVVQMIWYYAAGKLYWH